MYRTLTGPVGIEPRRGAATPLLLACSGLVLGALVLATAPARNHRTDASSVQAVKWIAQPAGPAVDVTADEQVIAARTHAARPREWTSACSTVVTFRTARLVARTRWGGLYGP